MKTKSSVQKTCDVLFYLAAHPEGERLSEIAEALGFPKTTVYDILHTLLNNDMLQYANRKTKKYGIGAQIYAMGMTFLDSSALLTIARPYLMLLANKYEKTTFVSKRHNDRVTCVYKCASPGATAPTSNVGDQKMLHSTAIGKCYLAFDTAASGLADTIDLIPFTDHTVIDRDALKAHLRELRRLGYSYEKRESHEKMSCLAAPIFHHGAMVATISMTGFYRGTESFTNQGNELMQLAHLISDQLDATTARDA